MLHVQQYLKDGKTLTQLTADFGIKTCFHPTEPLVILNYDQIESPKTHPIVRECRGLVLHAETFDLVAKGFDRFFNEGEAYELTKDFDWSNPVDIRTKEDGSYINLFNYDGRILITTRGSWADGECGFSGKTWAEIVTRLLPDPFKLNMVEYLSEGTNLIFELCSMHNKVVRSYPEAKLVLLGGTVLGTEVDPEHLDGFARTWGFDRPERHLCGTIDAVKELIDRKAAGDATWEGVVLRDVNGMRLKVKSAAYVSLHHMRGEGDNLYHPRYIIPFILKGEQAEVLTYFPEIKDRLDEVEDKVNELYDELIHYYSVSYGITDQKEFALTIRGCRLSSILFRLKKECRLTFEDINAEVRDASDQFYKILYR